MRNEQRQSPESEVHPEAPDFAERLHALACALETGDPGAIEDLGITASSAIWIAKTWAKNQGEFIRTYGTESKPESRLEEASRVLTVKPRLILHQGWNKKVTLSPVSILRHDPLREDDGAGSRHGLHNSPQREKLPLLYREQKPDFIRAFIAQALIRGNAIGDALRWLCEQKYIDATEGLTEELASAKATWGTTPETKKLRFLDWLQQGISPETKRDAAAAAKKMTGG